MIYQIENSMQGDTIEIVRGKNVSFPPHMHNSFEFVAITDGKMRIAVDRREYELSRGDAILIFPHQIHEYINDCESEYLLAIFSPDLVQAYSNVFSNSIPIDNRLKSPEPHIARIESLLGEKTKKTRLFLKGALYSLCAEFDMGAEYTPKKFNNHSLISRIFEFVEKNYKGDATLAALAAHTGYHYVYLSRCFKEYTGLSFVEYVGKYRINAAKRILSETSLSVLGVALECGFNSLRSFNRTFKAELGMTPTEYRLIK